MKRAVLASLIAAVALAFAAPTATAQKKKTEKKPKTKVYDFSGDDITGELIRPDGEGIRTRVFASHTSLIRLRTNFIQEILKSAENL